MFETLRGFGVRRNTDDRWLAGVCSGVADRLGIDPLIVRGVLIVLLFVGGIGGLAYLIAWALLPDQNGKILAEAALHGDGWGIALLIVIGIALDQQHLGPLVAVDHPRPGRPPGLVGDPFGPAGQDARADERGGARVRQQVRRDVLPSAGRDRRHPQRRRRPRHHRRNGASAHVDRPLHPRPHRGAARDGPRPHRRRRRPRARGAPPRRRGGFLGLLLTAGLAVAGYGIGKWYATSVGFEGSPELLAVGFAVAAAGLALLVIGLTGRRAGFTAFLVTVAALGAVAATSMPALPSGGFGERTWIAASQPAGGFSLTAGEARLALDGVTERQHGLRVDGRRRAEHHRPEGHHRHDRPDRASRPGRGPPPGTTKEVRSGVETENGQPIIVGSGPTTATVNISMVAGEIVITEES